MAKRIRICICDLPQDILVEIFSRLPAKSVGKCRCLSKYWSTYLSTPQFINLHLKTRKTRQENAILLKNPGKSLAQVFPPHLNNEAVVYKFYLLPNDNTSWARLHGSCNGLVLLQNTERRLFLVNPVTQQQIKIPDFNFDSTNTYHHYRAGLGYDLSCDDYKVVKLSWDNKNKMIAFVDVYSVRRGVWKIVVTDKYPCVRPPIPYHSFMAFVNGALHWFTTSSGPGSELVIVSFDLEHEVFREIPFTINVPEDVINGVLVLRGCLCVYVDRSTVWMMKEYGIAESWISYPPIRMSCALKHVATTPLCFISDDEFLCQGSVSDWFVYNLKDHEAKRVSFGGFKSYFNEASVFVDSLVSLDQHGRETEYSCKRNMTI